MTQVCVSQHIRPNNLQDPGWGQGSAGIDHAADLLMPWGGMVQHLFGVGGGHPGSTGGVKSGFVPVVSQNMTVSVALRVTRQRSESRAGIRTQTHPV